MSALIHSAKKISKQRKWVRGCTNVKIGHERPKTLGWGVFTRVPLYKFWFCTDISVAFEPNLKIFGRFRQNQPNLPNMWNKITYFLSEKKFKKILKGQEGKIRTRSSQPYTWNIFFWTMALNVTCNTIFFGLGTHCSAWKTWSFLAENGVAGWATLMVRLSTSNRC